MMKIISKISLLMMALTFSLLLLACEENSRAELIISGDYRTSYYLDEAFSNEGMIVTYQKGEESYEVTEYEVNGFDASKVGTNTITIKYLDATTQITLNILFGKQTETVLKIYDMPSILKTSER